MHVILSEGQKAIIVIANIQEICFVTRDKQWNSHVLLLLQERDGYKRIIDTYDSEMTVNYQSVESQRLCELQSVLETYKKQVAEFEAQTESINVSRHCSIQA